jgi:hypothetical protein
MEFITDIISEQNYQLLEKISLKKYNDECDREKFINKYYKKNYFRFKINKKNNMKFYINKIRLNSKK